MPMDNVGGLADELSIAIWRYHDTEQVGNGLTRMAVCRALIPLLAGGYPVSLEELAAAMKKPLADVTAVIQQHMNIEYDSAGRIIGAGITLQPTPHQVYIDGRTLYTWCALDALMYPPLLGRPVQVESPCAATGVPIRMVVTPAGVEGVNPPDAVVSILKPQKGLPIRQAFCNDVNFFYSAEAASSWLIEHPEAAVVAVADAYQLGQQLCETCD
jgi:alkylmercury lyase